MNRAILIQCLLPFIALAVTFLALVALVKFSGARLNLRRLRKLHGCQDGGVQSLAFVLTLPVFIMFVLFVVQVSQLMIGMITVNYAAYAAARAAIVWLPANVPQENPYLPETQNQVNWQQLNPVPSNPGERLTLIPGDPSIRGQMDASAVSDKFSRIRTAAVLGCAPVSPSRDIAFYKSANITLASKDAYLATQRIYQQLAPGSANNARISARLENKIRYADRNTIVYVEWRDALPGPNTLRGPTYNPVGHDRARQDYEKYGYKPYEVGWQDPVTVFVVHRFALFPGPGRMLAKLLVRPVGVPDRIRQRILVDPDWQTSYIAESETYSVLIPAAATLPAEGLKSVSPYVQQTF